MPVDSPWSINNDDQRFNQSQDEYNQHVLTAMPMVYSAIQATLSQTLIASLLDAELISLQYTVESHQFQLVQDLTTELYYIVGCDVEQFRRLHDTLCKRLSATIDNADDSNLPDVKLSDLTSPISTDDVFTNASEELASQKNPPEAKRKRGRPRKVSSQLSPLIESISDHCDQQVQFQEADLFKVPIPIQDAQKRFCLQLASNPENAEIDDEEEEEDVPEQMIQTSESSIDRAVILSSRRLRTRDLPPSVHRGRTHLARHEYETLAPYRFFCTVCSFRSKRASHLHKHMLLHDGAHAVNVLECPSCPYRTTRANHLSVHRLQHRSGSLLRCDCDGCAYRTDNSKHLARHKLLKHCTRALSATRKILRCSVADCDYETQRPYLMQRHNSKHRCASIPKKAGLKDKRTKPEYIFSVDVETADAYNCNQCEFKTSERELFLQHSCNARNDSKSYLCDHCGRSFKRSQSLVQHIVTHSATIDEHTYTHACSTCGKRFRALGHLREHVATHSVKREHLCEHCGAAFKTKMVRRKHVQTIHDNPRAYACTICEKKFNTNYSLLRHSAIHEVAG